MLSRAHRLTSTLDYSRVVRRGARFSSGSVVMHVQEREVPGEPSRFGFVVSKAVGNAPQRNLIKRRLRMLARPLVSELDADVILRALPSAASSSWDALNADVAQCVAKYRKSHA